jgi:hypothetical protein
MKTKKYSIIKSILWPFKTTIEIGADLITMNGKTIKWKEIESFCCHIISVNNGMNYIISIIDKQKKSIKINMVHNMLAAKAKKEKFAEIYESILANITKQHILPKTENMLHELLKGKELKISGVLMTADKVEISKGIIKKEKLNLPVNMIKLVFHEGTGGFRISSKSNEKDSQHIPLADPESRYLLLLLTKLTT